MKKVWNIAIFLFLMAVNVSGEENVYDRFFPKYGKTEFNDTMFERVIWHKKVSFLVLETLDNGFYVTMLVIPEYPYNFKGTTYPLHYSFASYEEAFKKFTWLDEFLKNKGILKVSITGSLIKSEKIMSNGELN